MLPLLVVVAAAMASTGSTADSVAFKDCAFTTSSAVNEIGAYIERHRFQLPEPHVDACTSGHISPSCPMSKGHVYTYRYTLPVREIYPAALPRGLGSGQMESLYTALGESYPELTNARGNCRVMR
ncbi:hypothetical protein HPB52_008732 [Rhipicephalus sanguineus]|uniref:MD-2-related lipid-recognition domain-containing protein n=1 Tax=Rhipicephalus sanguineus TaxID=34632 RepID=A0A9D4PYW6_RHISA|nr:hypothetical protein HPB52_008732 [Rhipicephalus sanguineus]